MAITPRQIRAARALLGWSQAELAQRAGVHKNALARLEAGRTDPRVSTMDAVIEALTAEGITFTVDADGSAEGVQISAR
ncbi:MAG: helix-turn-helix domain-containing protein [Magnetospirillum sp.]|nr:helix-turn-helix domain-containing protein [Magnetospirillum sp.]